MTTSVEWIDHVPTVIADPDIGARVYRIPPGDLALGRNVRRDVDDDPEFAASIAELGVLQPLVAYIDPAPSPTGRSRLQVLMGQRRALVAHQVGRPWVPVVLCDPPDDADRIVDQLTENRHRAPITVADDVAALSQLALIGLTVDEIAKRNARPRADVAAAVKVAASPAAVAAAAAAPVDLEQAAAIAELAEDPAAVEQLTAAARQSRGAFDHVHQQLVDAAHDRAEQARVLDELRAAGVEALERVDWTKATRLADLGIAPSKHRRCPGHAGFAAQQRTYVDGRVVWSWSPGYVCTEPKRHRPAAGPETLDDEAARARRAEVIENNRRWRAAEVVRRRWLREFVRLPRPPAGVEAFIAAALLRGDDCIRRAAEQQQLLLRDLLAPDGRDALTSEAGRAELDELVGRTAATAGRRPLVVAAAALLAAWDWSSDVHCWRDRYDGSALMNRLGGFRGVDSFYMGWFIRFGYIASGIERLLIIDESDASAPGAEPAAAAAPTGS